MDPGQGHNLNEDPALVGQVISHYRILEKLGAGGMGVVYAALDTRLDRPVALKFLGPGLAADPEDRERLIREAKAASSLDHPNVCTIHEIAESPDGRLFIVMALYEGVSLAKRVEEGPLPIAEAVDIAAQIADGLQAAHKKGIVHRDIKSGNVMLTGRDRAVLMDFGLAVSPGTSKLTKTGMTLGTVPYMSPEQARGDRTDHRTDLWSLGVIVYEMLTGQMPFRSEYELAVVYSILNEDPEPIGSRRADVPGELERIVAKAMTKDISERYQEAGGMAADLKALSRSLDSRAATVQDPASAPVAATVVAAAPVAANPGPRRRRRLLYSGAIAALALAALVTWRLAAPGAEVFDSIAVLPLDNLTGDESQEYFVDGMHEALIAELAGIGALKVISRTSAMRYKGELKPSMPQIARELGVDGLVEGSVSREGNRVRISVRLIHGPDDRHLWQGSFERELKSVLALQAEVARAITDQIRVATTPQERVRLTSDHEVDPQAYEAYLLGRHYWNRRTILGLRHAIEQFRKAVNLDSTYVPAWVAMVDAYMLLGEQGGMSQGEARALGSAAIATALSLDRDQTESQHTLGQWELHYELDWGEAEHAFERAIELSPGDAIAYGRYGRALATRRRFDEAMPYSRRAVDLDPLSPITGSYLGVVLLFAGRYDEAEAELKRTDEINPDHALVLHNIGEVDLARGRYDASIPGLERSVELSGQVSGFPSSHYLAILGAAYAGAGRRADALAIRDRLAARDSTHLVSEFDMAIMTLALGDRDGAIAWLEHGLESRDVWLAEINAWPWFAPLRDDPRFQSILRQLGFTEP